MAASKGPLSGSRRRYTVDQSGAPEPETNDATVWIGRQPGAADAPVEEPAPADADT